MNLSVDEYGINPLSPEVAFAHSMPPKLGAEVYTVTFGPEHPLLPRLAQPIPAINNTNPIFFIQDP